MTTKPTTLPSPFRTSAIHGGRCADTDPLRAAIRQEWPDAWVEYDGANGNKLRVLVGLARNDKPDHADRIAEVRDALNRSGLATRMIGFGSQYIQIVDHLPATRAA